METKYINNQFNRIGSRILFQDRLVQRRWMEPTTYVIDVSRDRQGEFFGFWYGSENLRLQVLDTQCKDRHLLLLVDSRSRRDGFEKTETTWQKFLCGHDERHLFVAGVNSRCTNVNQAMESLKPAAVIASQDRFGVKAKRRHKRKNDGFVRQGEWFFIPRLDMKVADKAIWKNEPLMRGGGKPHIAEYLYRRGGTTVYVNQRYPSGITEESYKKLLDNEPDARKLRWRVMTRDPDVFVRGRIRHSDHKTVILDFWHQVLPNQEVFSRSMAFLD